MTEELDTIRTHEGRRQGVELIDEYARLLLRARYCERTGRPELAARWRREADALLRNGDPREAE